MKIRNYWVLNVVAILPLAAWPLFEIIFQGDDVSGLFAVEVAGSAILINLFYSNGRNFLVRFLIASIYILTLLGLIPVITKPDMATLPLGLGLFAYPVLFVLIFVGSMISDFIRKQMLKKDLNNINLHDDNKKR